MRIERITLHHLRLPLVHPFETSFGREGERDTLIVRIDSEGLAGHGECPAGRAPLYAGETVATCRIILREHLAPAVLGRDLGSVAELLGAIAPLRGNRFARAGLEAAFTDLLARARGCPLRGLLAGGGKTRERIEVGVSIGIQPSVEALLERVQGFLERGYRRIKIKIRPGWDLLPLERIRERFGDIPLMADANAAYAPGDEARLRELDPLGLMMIEQPLDEADLLGHARLQESLATPICLDESIPGPRHVEAALALGAMRILNIKPARVGGLASARRCHDLCLARGVPVWCGGLLETGIGRAHNLALASLAGFTLPGDLSESARYWDEDVIEPPVTMARDGTVEVPSGPGLGFEVIEERLRRHALATEILVP